MTKLSARVTSLLPESVLGVSAKLRQAARVRWRERRAWAQLLRDAEWLSEHSLESLGTGRELAGDVPLLRAQLLWMLGLQPMPTRQPLNAAVRGHLSEELYVVERMTFESLPGLVVTANLYLPRGCERPSPCVIYLCGHMPNAHGAKVGFQERYLWYARNGIACLVLDPVGFGEVQGIHRGTHDLSMWDWLSLGYTPAGVEVWNGMRAIDYLESRTEIDARRIGVTGISGGGAATWYLSAADERVKAAAPSCSTYSIGQQTRARIVREQCDCVFLPNVYGFDLPTVAALIAPRPLLITGGTRDPIFPPRGFRRTYALAREAYRRVGGEGAVQRVRLVEARCGHEDPPRFLAAVHEWMVRWLGPVAASAGVERNGDERVRPGTDLRCLDVAPAHALNYSVHRHFVPSLTLPEPYSKEDWGDRRTEILERLRKTVFRWMPESAALATAARAHESAYYAGKFGTFEAWTINPEPGVDVRLLGVRAERSGSPPMQLLVVRSREEGWQFPDLEPVLPLLGRLNVSVLYPRFMETALAPARYGEIERTAAATGRTIAALQVWDTLQVASWLAAGRGGEAGPVVVVGRGGAAVAALYAAVLCDAIAGVVLWDPPSSHRIGPPLLTVLRTTDLPEVAAMLAPRPLVFVGEIPSAFDWTRTMFERCGALAAIGAEESVGEAVSRVLATARARVHPFGGPEATGGGVRGAAQ